MTQWTHLLHAVKMLVLMCSWEQDLADNMLCDRSQTVAVPFFSCDRAIVSNQTAFPVCMHLYQVQTSAANHGLLQEG